MMYPLDPNLKNRRYEQTRTSREERRDGYHKNDEQKKEENNSARENFVFDCSAPHQIHNLRRKIRDNYESKERKSLVWKRGQLSLSLSVSVCLCVSVSVVTFFDCASVSLTPRSLSRRFSIRLFWSSKRFAVSMPNARPSWIQASERGRERQERSRRENRENRENREEKGEGEKRKDI